MSNEITDAEIERDLAFAIHTARAAGERVLALRETGRWEGKTKADIGDQAADGWLQGALFGRYPDDGVLSEETADTPARLDKFRTWIVDPLDGTREYSQDREDWAVHVALTFGGKPGLAAVALPSLNSVLWGVALPGRERFGVEGEGQMLSGAEPGPSPDAPRLVASRSHTPPWMEAFGAELGGTLEGWGSAGYKVARLLRGDGDVYVHKIGLKEWDTCAPETVARAAGWTVCKLRGEDHVYNRPDPHNHELVVCRPEWKDRVIAAVARSGALDD